MYLAGPYLVAYAAGMPKLANLLQIQFILHAFFFLFVANISLYAIESLHLDMTTPASRKQWKTYFFCFVSALFLNILLIGIETTLTARVFSLIFFFTVLALNVPFVRYKAHCIFDLVSLVPVAISGILGFYLANGSLPSLIMIIASLSFYIGMLLFSSIAKPGVYRHGWFARTATALGRKKSLIVSAGFLSMATGILIFSRILLPWSFFISLYPLLPLILLVKQKISVSEITYYFPEVNTGVMVLSLLLIVIGKPLV